MWWAQFSLAVVVAGLWGGESLWFIPHYFTMEIARRELLPIPKEDAIVGNKKDFFISYNSQDKAWAEWIAWEIEQMGHTTIIQAWDFNAGGNFVNAMQEAAKNTERTIAVLSQNYLDAQFTHPEWHAAFRQDPKGEKGLLIPVRIGECDLDGLLSQIVYIDLVGVDENQAGQVLRDQLTTIVTGERRKPKAKPGFPGAASTAPAQENDRPAPPPPAPAASQAQAAPQPTPSSSIDPNELSAWLLERMKKMLSAMLDDIAFQYGVPDEYIPGNATQADKARATLKFGKEKEGDNLPKLRQLVAKTTSRQFPH